MSHGEHRDTEMDYLFSALFAALAAKFFLTHQINCATILSQSKTNNVEPEE